MILIHLLVVLAKDRTESDGSNPGFALTSAPMVRILSSERRFMLKDKHLVRSAYDTGGSYIRWWQEYAAAGARILLYRGIIWIYTEMTQFLRYARLGFWWIPQVEEISSCTGYFYVPRGASKNSTTNISSLIPVWNIPKGQKPVIPTINAKEDITTLGFTNGLRNTGQNQVVGNSSTILLVEVVQVVVLLGALLGLINQQEVGRPRPDAEHFVLPQARLHNYGVINHKLHIKPSNRYLCELPAIS